MKTNPNELRLVISGRWPFSTVQGNDRYYEISILDNESLQDFVVTPDTVRYMMNLDLLEMYIKTEVLDVVERPHMAMDVLTLARVSEIQARVEVDAYVDSHAGEGGDDFDGDALNDAYDSNEMSDSGDDNDNDNDQQPVNNVPQNTPFHRENIPFMYHL
ncbi:hypothetical protein K7X08_000561 [Anisodus acutangulus]|uniref:Uncharacterized protein n=1 Tax=Anisodus acutangulus TaxID=402998 RepID=A0A9Q1M6X9_9SOLA|nr:hypothetical protein K7X08_000561 [Anisodus acutangulus]